MVTRHVKGTDTEARRQKGLAGQGEHLGIPVSIQGFPSPPPPCSTFPSSDSSWLWMGQRCFSLGCDSMDEEHVKMEMLSAEEHTRVHTHAHAPATVFQAQ